LLPIIAPHIIEVKEDGVKALISIVNGLFIGGTKMPRFASALLATKERRVKSFWRPRESPPFP